MKQTQQQLADIRLLIGIPSQGMMCMDSALSLALMASDLTFPLKGKSHIYQIVTIKSSLLPEGRQRIVDAALAGDATHLLFIDTDMVFPHDLARKWLAHNQDVVAANCPTRSFPTNPTARNQDASVVYSNGKRGLEKVWRVGTGIMMLSAKALRALPRPAFTPYWNEEKDAYVGEDWAMVDHLEKAGFHILIDHDMSQQIGHIGTYTFTHEDIELEQSSLILPNKELTTL